jgi:hypothetical protein
MNGRLGLEEHIDMMQTGAVTHRVHADVPNKMSLPRARVRAAGPVAGEWLDARVALAIRGRSRRQRRH